MKSKVRAAFAALVSVVIGFIRDDGPVIRLPAPNPDAIAGFDLYIDSDNLTYVCQGCAVVMPFSWYSTREHVRLVLTVHRARCTKPIVGAVLSAGRSE